MDPVLVDSNVLLDIATQDPVWAAWSGSALERAADEAILVINPIIYAEVSIGFPTIEAVEAALPADLYRREDLPYDAAFLAGKCFLRYRRSGGPSDRHCRTSTSVPTRRSPATGSSPATRLATPPTSRRSP